MRVAVKAEDGGVTPWMPPGSDASDARPPPIGRRVLRLALLDALSVIAPTQCSGCGVADRALCSSCRAALRVEVQRVDVPALGGHPAPPLAAFCALRYDGVARRVLLAIKETGRTDAAPALAEALTVALTAALAAALPAGPATGPRAAKATVEIATIPSTRAAFRSRGYHPTKLILSHAGLRASCPLRATRQTADQASLGLAGRAANRHGSLIATTALHARSFILVDDIVTTGATMREAQRAIQAAGGTVLGAAAIANTVRLRPRR